MKDPERDLMEAATRKPYLQVRDEAGRQVSRSLKHDSLDVVGPAIERYEQDHNRALRGDSHGPERLVDARNRSLK